MESYPGVAHLIGPRTRNVLLDAWYIDPNRMFSREGAARSLARLNLSYPPRLLDYLDRERPRMLRAILPAPGGLLIALHNNSEGYSMQHEIPISERVVRKTGESPHDFFLCTDPQDFETLAASPYNAVLQSRPMGIEDGSLSRLAARMKVRYVNLEVTLGQREKQTEMLHWLERHAR
jgi:hypothetical protein